MHHIISPAMLCHEKCIGAEEMPFLLNVQRRSFWNVARSYIYYMSLINRVEYVAQLSNCDERNNLKKYIVE